MRIRILTGMSRAVWLFVPLGVVFFATCPAAADIVQPAYRRCGTGPRINCIVDGDTLWNDGVKIRIADIDAPEISQPHCATEKALGERATLRLMELVNVGPFAILAWKNRDQDRNGRKLRS